MAAAALAAEVSLKAVSAAAPAAQYRPLGALRLLLALLVLFQHQLHLLPPADRALFYRGEVGVVAVAAFFAISGFIVSEANATFYRDRPFAFLSNRLLRLVPAYVAAVLLAATAQGWLHATGRFVPLDGPLQGSPVRPAILVSAFCEILPGVEPRYVSGANFSLIPFAWTLRIEIAFYLAAAAACAWRGRVRQVLALALGYAAFAVGLLRDGEPQILVYLPLFLFGIAGYDFLRRPSFWRLAHLSLAGLCIAIGFSFWHQRGAPVLAWQLVVLTALLALFLALAGCKRLPAAARRFDRACGDLAYPLYLSHGTVLILLADAGPAPGPTLYALGIILSLLLAFALHRAVELPMRPWRDRLRGGAI